MISFVFFPSVIKNYINKNYLKLFKTSNLFIKINQLGILVFFLTELTYTNTMMKMKIKPPNPPANPAAA